MTALDQIEGIGPAVAKKLKAEGVDTVEDLLLQGSTSRGRRALSVASGVAEKRILTWVNYADLFRIKGVAGEMAELLEATGVDSVPELARRNADNLAAALKEHNDEAELVRTPPSAKVVTGWIAQAKGMEKAVFH